MPLNRKTLKWSLESLISSGKTPLQYDTYRDYVVLYNNTLKYIKDNIGESETLKELYPKFPIIELEEFNKPVDYILSFLCWFPRIPLALVTLRGFGIVFAFGGPMKYNPRWKRYRNSITDNQGLIYTLASEMIMRVGE